MKKSLKIYTVSLVLLTLASCETTSTRPYQASTDNVMKFQRVISETGNKVNLGYFSNDSNPLGMCRLNGPVDVSPGKTIAQYIKEAMQTELLMAQAYDESSAVTINAQLNDLNFSSVSPAKWTFELALSSNVSSGYTVSSSYNFKTSYSAVSACRNVADAFGPAVQDLIKEVISHPGFKALIQEK